MAGSKMTHWQKVAITRLREIRDHPDYPVDFAILHASVSNERLLMHNLEQFCRKYQTPRGVIYYLKRLIQREENDYNNITPPVMLVSEVDGEVLPSDNPKNMMVAYREFYATQRKGRVYLDITADTKRKDIDDFLDLYFEKSIKQKLKLIDEQRTNADRQRQQLPEYYKVIRLYSDLADSGIKRGIYDRIQIETKIDPLRIKKFIARYRQERKYNLTDPLAYRDIKGQQ